MDGWMDDGGEKSHLAVSLVFLAAPRPAVPAKLRPGRLH